MNLMDVESIRLLDEVNDLDVLEVHYLTELGEERTVVGSYGGLRKAPLGWVLRLVSRRSIPTIDIERIRLLTRAEGVL